MNEDVLRGIVREIFPKQEEQIAYNGHPIGADQGAPDTEQAAEQARHTEICLRYTAQCLFQGIDPVDNKIFGIYNPYKE